MAFRKYERRERRPETPQKEWIPRTELGRKVAAGEIASIDVVFDSGKKILEPQIIDALLPDLKDEVLERKSTQRMTASGRKQRMRAVVVLGNRNGYVGVGVGKAPDTRMAIEEAIVDAKKHILRVNLGCGSWECGCGTTHSIKQKVTGKSGTTEVIIKPAPRGVGIVSGETSKKVLQLAGVKDAWLFTKGRSRNILNTVLAIMKALESMNRLKKGTNPQVEVTEAVAVVEPAKA